jgi:hypothetical protein
MYLRTSSSNDNFPPADSCAIAAPTNCFDTEPASKEESLSCHRENTGTGRFKVDRVT